MLGIEPQPEVELLAGGARGGDLGGKAAVLHRGVEDHRVRKPEDLGQVRGLVSRAIGFDDAVIMVATKLRFPQARGADPVEIFADHIAERPHGEGLEREQHLRARSVSDILQRRQIAADRGFVDDETGRRNALQVEMGKCPRITGSGFHQVSL